MIRALRTTWNAMRSRQLKPCRSMRAATGGTAEHEGFFRMPALATRPRNSRRWKRPPTLGGGGAAAYCCCCVAALAASSGDAAAQVVLPLVPPTLPPWNAQRVFEPLPFPYLWDTESRKDRAPEDTPVRTRQHPGYESIGVRAGSWMLHPAATAGVFYDSNLFSSNSAKQGGLAAVVNPSVTATSLWERHAFELKADLQSKLYPEHSELNETNARLRGRGRIDIRHDAMVLTRFEAAHLHEEVGSISSPAGAVRPTPYDLLSADATYQQEFNRLTASAGLGIDSYNFGTTVAQNGTVIDQSTRDGQIYFAHGRLDYAISPLLGLFSALELNRRDLRGSPAQSLDSSGYRTLSGVSLQLTRLVSAELAAGYSRQNFEAFSLGVAEGPAYRASLVWSPSRVLDIQLRGIEMVTQATDTDAQSIRVRALQLGFDYEFRRNIVLSVAGTYERDKFLTQPRSDRVYAARTELKYLLNRFGSIGLQHVFVRRESTVPFANFDKHQVGINVTAHY